MFKKGFVDGMCVSLLAATPVMADINSEISIAEKTLGIEGTGTTVEKKEALEKELGITPDKDVTIVERLSAIEIELGISDSNSSTGNDDLIAPSENFIMERLKYIDTMM